MNNEPIKVERGIPIPRKISGARGIYPWREMEVGDSFLIEGLTAKYRSRIAAAQSTRDNRKYATRKVGENAYRVWRIA